MSPVEQLRVGLFLAVVALILGRSAIVLMRKAIRRLGAGSRTAEGDEEFPTHRLPRGGRIVAWLDRLVLAAALAGAICIAYGVFVEPYWPEITHVRIETPKLPMGAGPVRIVHLSDIHSDARPRLEERLPDLVAREKPDVIVFTGDAINQPSGLPVFRACLQALASIAPVYAVQGNWDVRHWKDERPLEGSGAHELDADAVRLTVRGAEIWLGGLAVDHTQALPHFLDRAPAEVFTIFLHHYPDEIHGVARRGIDLYLAGHTHGGQVALPFYGALVTFSRFGKRYESGLYRDARTTLYVNRGIGMEGGVLRVRFCARPEITVIEIVPKG